MTPIDQQDLSPVQTDLISGLGGMTRVERPATLPWLKERAWLTFGALRRVLTKPARLFHSRSEADRVRNQVETQRLSTRHFRGGSGF